MRGTSAPLLVCTRVGAAPSASRLRRRCSPGRVSAPRATEMADINNPVSVAVIDEIQMIGTTMVLLPFSYGIGARW